MNDATPRPIYSTDMGNGPRRMLAVHCTLAHSGAWSALAREIADEVTMTAFDLPSHGRSADWDRQGDYQDVSVAAGARLLTEPMDVIGHSFGATVALRLAVAFPDLVRSLTLIEPVFFAVALQDDPAVVAEHDADAGPFGAAIAAGDDALAARLFNRMWSGNPRWPDLPEQTRAAMTRAIHVVPASRPAIYDDRAGLLAPGVLDAVAMPVLLLRGSTSHPIIGVVNDGLARRMPNTENRVVDGAGHMLPISHPQQTAALLWAHLERAG